MTDDANERPAQEDRRATANRLRRDLALGAAIVFVLFLVFRHHDSNGNSTRTPSPTPTTNTRTG